MHNAQEVALVHGVTRPVLYRWKKKLLGKETGTFMTDDENGTIQETKEEELLDELTSLKKEIRELKLELDVMRFAAEIIKKRPGRRPQAPVEQGENTSARRPVHNAFF